VSTTSDVTALIWPRISVGQMQALVGNFASLLLNFKKSRGKNKLVDDIQHSLNYKMSTIVKKIFSHFKGRSPLDDFWNDFFDNLEKWRFTNSKNKSTESYWLKFWQSSHAQ
jgi:hypothetical protein